MSYIKDEYRELYEKDINNIVENLLRVGLLLDESQVGGHFNYVVSSIIKRYLDKKGKNYSRLQSFEGSLACISKEYYRRIVGPYEDEAIKKNGDIR